MVEQYEVGDSFKENDVAAVHSMTIIDVSAGEYTLAEEWVNADGKSVWVEYEIPERGLTARIDQGKCEPAGSVSESRFQTVMEHIERARQRT
mgnify:CR=1 FL=1